MPGVGEQAVRDAAEDELAGVAGAGPRSTQCIGEPTAQSVSKLSPQ
ncbi:hypothetical protein [Streptomyces sp. XY533]